MDTRKLRQKLLDLAIRGKLVPQDPNDESASELLSRIHKEKLAMVERGELKPKDVKNDTVIYFGSDGLPYEKQADGKGESTPIERAIRKLPSGWAWTRMRMVARVEAGKTPSKDAFVDEGIPYFKMFNLRNQAIDFAFHPQFIKPEIHYGQLGKSQIHPGDLIMNIVGPPLGKLAIVPNSFPEANTNQAAVVIHSYSPEVPIAWLFYYLSEMSEINNVSTRGSAGQVNISVNQSREMFVAIPPLAEQRRIVDALDKYLALVDGIERDRADLDGLLAQLKSKVLDLAVRGELVEHDPGDEPASELLSRIREEKLAMVGRGELKPKDVKNDTVIFTGSDGLRYEKPADGKGEAKCIEGAIPFEIPEGWSWCRLLTPVALNPKNDVDDETPASFLPMAAIEEGFRNQYHPEIRRWKEIKKGFTQFADGDVVFAKISPCFENGKYFIASCLESGAGAGSTELYVLRSPSKGLYRKYLFYFLASNYFMGDAKKTFMGSVGQQRIKKDYLERMMLPVPPLGEQHRIVKTIEAAFSLTNL